MRKLVTGFAALFLFSSAIAQDLGFIAGFGIAAYRMDDMKYYQEFILGKYPVEGKVISSFPPYAMGSFGIQKKVLSAVKIGAGYAYSSTGGRTNYTDYSGSISTNIVASSHRLGAWISYSFLSNSRYDLSIFGRVDANITRLGLTTSIYAMGYSDGVSNRYGSVSPAGSAGLEFFLHFNAYSVGLNGGYLVDKPGKLSNLSSNSELNDPSDPQRILTTDWTGWQAQVMVMIWLGR